ncbi:hypothetical protein [Streptomyces phaeochromogenes]|uniref:Transmembrane protein n=1 Tax=Streptomyces phaeochromogenes TaxID=1923 RepID=A0ABZ1H2J2_STRPH|nr:hypothetical protein [Streptomyces phaeochromogenes]WRZ27201.1 hypothetical protein OG931_05300 [Streptomyces phaeochromogenes]WSD12766.1 hypothetical protein OHB35_05710 [Streptomyces phaeochromogenes]
MAGPPRLRPEDRADFEDVLRRALSTTDIRTALLADPTSAAATRLRAQALRAVDEITAAAGDEYREYLAARTVVERGRRSRTGEEHGRLSTTTAERGQQPGTTAEQDRQPQPADPGALLPALAALTPPIAGTAAAVLLVLGYSLRLADAQGSMGGSLVTAGWVFATIAVASALAGLTALLCTALRARPGHGDRTGASARNLHHARARWQRALLERGMLPYLRRQLAATRFD